MSLMSVLRNGTETTEMGVLQVNPYLTLALPPVKPSDFRLVFFSASTPLTYSYKHTNRFDYNKTHVHLWKTTGGQTSVEKGM